MSKITDVVAVIWRFILNIGAYIAKNLALLVGIVESLAKLLVGLINILAPAKQKDILIAYVDKVASAIKKILYTISDKLAGLTVPGNV